jgi:hypothetical protein
MAEEEGNCECASSAVEVVNEPARRKRKMMTESASDIKCVKKAAHDKDKKKIVLVYVVGAYCKEPNYGVVKVSYDLLSKEQLVDLGNANSTNSMDFAPDDVEGENGHPNDSSGVITNLEEAYHGGEIEGYKTLDLKPNVNLFDPDTEEVMATYAIWCKD